MVVHGVLLITQCTMLVVGTCKMASTDDLSAGVDPQLKYRLGQQNDPVCFCQNFVKSPPNLIIFGTQIAKTIEICEVRSLSTSSNLCQRTTV